MAEKEKSEGESIGAITLKWLGLAIMQTVICSLLWQHGDISWWYFLEPLFVALGAIWVWATRDDFVATLMLFYISIVALMGFIFIVVRVFTDGFLEALHALHTWKDVGELWLAASIGAEASRSSAPAPGKLAKPITNLDAGGLRKEAPHTPPPRPFLPPRRLGWQQPFIVNVSDLKRFESSQSTTECVVNKPHLDTEDGSGS